MDVDTVIPTDHIGVDEIDQSISPSWTGSHDFVQPAPSSGFNVFTRYTEDGSTKQVRWGINSNGEIALRYTTGGGSPGTLMSFGSAFTGVEFFEQIIAGTGIRETSFQDYGASNEFREEYNSNQDSLDISDQPNSAVRARMDRSTGDLTIEGTLTEGATL